MRTSPRLVAAATAAALLVSACSSSNADPEPEPTSTSPTVTEEPSSEASSTPDDPFAMPDPVTEEYVDRVVNTLYEEWGAIMVEIIEQPADSTAVVGPPTQERMSQVFGGQYLQRRIEEANDRLRGNREQMLPAEEYDGISFDFRKVLRATPDCLIVIGDFDTTGTSTEPERILSTFSLEPADSTEENPTGWRLVDLVPNTTPDGEPMEDDVMLEATLEDLSGVLDTSCEGSAQS